MSAGPGVSRGPLPPLRVRAPAAAAGPQRGAHALLGALPWSSSPAESVAPASQRAASRR